MKFALFVKPPYGEYEITIVSVIAVETMSGGGAIFKVEGDDETEKPPPPLKIVRNSSENPLSVNNFTSVAPSAQPPGITKVPAHSPLESVSVEEEVNVGVLVVPSGAVRVTVTVFKGVKLCASTSMVLPVSAVVTFIVINGVLESPTVTPMSKNSFKTSPPVETSIASM